MGSGRSKLSAKRWRNKGGPKFLHVVGVLVTADCHAESNRYRLDPGFDGGPWDYRKNPEGNQFGGLPT
jgi:hypothetical protein